MLWNSVICYHVQIYVNPYFTFFRKKRCVALLFLWLHTIYIVEVSCDSSNLLHPSVDDIVLLANS
jgi:hypothetical protein